MKTIHIFTTALLLTRVYAQTSADSSSSAFLRSTSRRPQRSLQSNSAFTVQIVRDDPPANISSTPTTTNVTLSNFTNYSIPFGESDILSAAISPTSAPTVTPELQYFGNDNNEIPANVFPLPRCGGDCDDNDQCEGELICFQRDENESVPGCMGGLVDDTARDYCILPPQPTTSPPESPTISFVPSVSSAPSVSPAPSPRPTAEPTMMPTPLPTLEPTTPFPTPQPTTTLPTRTISLIGNDDDEIFPLQQCQGDCDSDDDCAGDMVCWQRDDGQPVPGCYGGEDHDESTDFCIQESDVTPNPTPQPTPSLPPVQVSPGSTFRLKLYWNNYCWQEECFEIKWCVYYNYDAKDCYYNNLIEDDCESDRMYLDLCGYGYGDDYHRHGDDWFRFLEVGGGRVMIQTIVGNYCWERRNTRISLRTCNTALHSQRWFALNGSFDGDRFEISQDGAFSQDGAPLCVSQAHHPKEAEVVQMIDCNETRVDDTSFWNRY